MQGNLHAQNAAYRLAWGIPYVGKFRNPLMQIHLALIPFIYKWNAFGIRCDLAYFVLFAPAAGLILEGLEKYKAGYLLTALLQQ